MEQDTQQTTIPASNELIFGLVIAGIIMLIAVGAYFCTDSWTYLIAGILLSGTIEVFVFLRFMKKNNCLLYTSPSPRDRG